MDNTESLHGLADVRSRAASLPVPRPDTTHVGPPPDAATRPREAWQRERFITRCQALFYARLAFLTIGLGILGVPAWQRALGAHTPWAYACYFFIIAYSVANYLVVDRGQLGRNVTFVTLNLDLAFIIYLIAWSGGLKSPVIVAQVVYTVFFALLFPRPMAILPPLLALPIIAKIDQLLPGRSFEAIDLFLLAWYFAINFIIVYVMIYMNSREEMQQRQILKLQEELRELAVSDERARLAREIHDGLGAALSGMLIQTEYIQSLAPNDRLRAEIGELRDAASEGMEELRRSVRMMRDDFDLLQSLQDYCLNYQSRTRIACQLTLEGRTRPLPSAVSLALFRVLQESLTNITKHARARQVDVRLAFWPEGIVLRIRDDGTGFELHRDFDGHYGLAGMRERARKVGGEVKVESAPGQGTQVEFTVAVTGGTGVWRIPQPPG